MDFDKKYDIEAIKKDLQKKLRIMDWDIIVEVVDGYGMTRQGEAATLFGLCEKWRKNKEAFIYLNKSVRDETNFLNTFIHEMVHVATDDFCLAAGEVAKFITDDTTREIHEEHLLLEYERQTESLAKSFEACLGKNYLDKFLTKEDKTDGNESKKSLRRKGR